MLDLSFSRLEKRVAVAVQLKNGSGELDVVATHLGLADRTRHRQVQSLLEHPRLREAPTLLLGDMNAWRQCKATRALEEELRKIRDEPIPLRELQKVKNQITASSYRRLANGFFLLLQLLIYDGMGDWGYINEWAADTLTVTADDVQRVAKTYFELSNRAVAQYSRAKGTASAVIPTELDGLPTEVQRQIMSQLDQIRALDDVNMLTGMLDQLTAQQEAAPPAFQQVFPLIERTILERIAELESGGGQ